MPINEIKYETTIIYKITCRDLTLKDFFVGHTTNFTKTKFQHKNLSKTNTTKIYKIIRDSGGWDNWDMLEIEKYPCHDKNEATAREQYYY